MSLILDALARAERDRRRRAGPVPDLLTPTTPASARPAVPRALLLALALFVVVVPGAWWFLAHPGTGASPAPPQAGVASRETTASPPAARRPTAAEVAAPVAPRAAAKVTPTRRETPAQRSAVDDRQGGPAAGSDAPVDAAVAALYAEDGAVGFEDLPEPSQDEVRAPPAQGAEALDIEAVLRAVRAEAAAAELLPHPAPLLASLSKRFRDAVPTLMYLRHDFNPSGNSTVFINGETLRVGARTRGVEIREILPDAVVLRFEGQDFRLKALNSWVNL